MENADLLKVINLLLNKYKKLNMTDKIDLDLIKKILFIHNSDGTLSIVDGVFHILCEKHFDMNGLSFDNVHIKGHDFSKLKNVVINIQKIPNYDISYTVLKGVNVIGCLNDAIIEGTNFSGYIGELVLNPQSVKDKSLYNTNLDSLKIDGSFDGCIIIGTNFKGCSGNVEIDPHLVYENNFSNTSLDGVKLVSKTGFDVDFDNCELYCTSFKNCRCDGAIVINPQKVNDKCLDACIFENVSFVGTFNNVSILGASFSGSKNAVIDLNKIKAYNMQFTDFADAYVIEEKVKKRFLRKRA